MLFRSGAGGGGGGSSAIKRGSVIIASAGGGGGGGGGGNNGTPANIGLGGGFAGPKSTGVGGMGIGDIINPGSQNTSYNDDGGGGGGGGGGYPLTGVVTGGNGGKGGIGDHTANWGEYGQSVVPAGFSVIPNGNPGGSSGIIVVYLSVMPA